MDKGRRVVDGYRQLNPALPKKKVREMLGNILGSCDERPFSASLDQYLQLLVQDQPRFKLKLRFMFVHALRFMAMVTTISNQKSSTSPHR
jgi:hypothetical protein